MIEEIKKHLTDDIIPFWLNLKDDEYGGFYGYIDYELNLDKKYEKGCILNSRITWFFSNAYMLLKDEKLLSAAEHGFRFLKNNCLDKENGGVFWSLNYDGTPQDTTKHTYNQAFAIYALCSYYEASKDAEALSYAWELFRLIEEKCTDEFGYLEAFKIDFTPESNEKLSENGVMAEKTMNTLLHVLEAYTQLYKITKDTIVKDRLLKILKIVETKIFNEKLQRQEVFFDSRYNSIIDLHSYGHDIETSWLIDLCLEIINDVELTDKMSVITRALAYKTYEIAFDGHSFANECERGVVNENRVWWVQAEAVVGFINAWQKTSDRKFYEAAKAQWDYIKNYIVDKRKNSEWLWEVDMNGNPIEGRPIVGPWKCPYHNGRMCFEVMTRLR